MMVLAKREWWSALLMLFGFAQPSFSQLQSANTFLYANNNRFFFSGPNSVSAYSVVSNKNQSDYGSLKELTSLGSPFLTGGLASGGVLYVGNIVFRFAGVHLSINTGRLRRNKIRPLLHSQV